jgi:two-component system C4-dicarboxylate transport response regulator DctD
MTEEMTAVVVEDDPEVRMGSVQALQIAGIRTVPLSAAEQALEIVQPGFRGIVVTDIRLPGKDGLSLLRELKRLDPALPVIVITGHGDVQTAVVAMRAGAADFLEKPFSSEGLAQIAKQALLARGAYLDTRELGDAPERIEAQIIGRSKLIREVRHKLLSLADNDVNVLIFGETGTGKELAARSLHEFGRRRVNPFVALNCAGLPETLFDSEVFGHEAGSFTGAMARRIGKVEYAKGGTLLLDEIETMPVSLQAKLLRALQERTFERLGSNQLLPMQCRIVAGTKVDLQKLAATGSFREDLYYRLGVVTVELPPLRERPEDVPMLFQQFVFDASSAFGQAAPYIPGAFMQELMTRQWLGNVRELKNVAERFVLGMLLPNESQGVEHDGVPSYERRVNDFERSLISDALRRTGGRIAAACVELGLPRKTLYDKMRRLGISRAIEDGGE